MSANSSLSLSNSGAGVLSFAFPFPFPPITPWMAARRFAEPGRCRRRGPGPRADLAGRLLWGDLDSGGAEYGWSARWQPTRSKPEGRRTERGAPAQSNGKTECGRLRGGSRSGKNLSTRRLRGGGLNHRILGGLNRCEPLAGCLLAVLLLLLLLLLEVPLLSSGLLFRVQFVQAPGDEEGLPIVVGGKEFSGTGGSETAILGEGGFEAVVQYLPATHSEVQVAGGRQRDDNRLGLDDLKRDRMVVFPRAASFVPGRLGCLFGAIKSATATLHTSARETKGLPGNADVKARAGRTAPGRPESDVGGPEDMPENYKGGGEGGGEGGGRRWWW
ncbi:hypothetical protein B0H16DRAFT_1704174 [Mycena metata]|uniref:Uncharacterized protein n=1 Tax=Mycena metata TaxID=1033252 RepID=A0AAD7M9U9_9AGAR|nr:hypothetical protein B0H16DRAFT_1704174 [Mycena metata]